MSQLDGANIIHWRDWSEEAFEAARSEDKQVLLTLGRHLVSLVPRHG